MTARELAKKLLPGSARRGIRTGYRLVDHIAAVVGSEARFLRHYSSSPEAADCEKIRARLTFHAHSLEKGLSHSDLRFGFGKSALGSLAVNMKRYRELGCPESDKAYQNALSVLDAYVVTHREEGHDLELVDSHFGRLMQEAAAAECTLGGIIEVTADDKTSNGAKNFAELFEGRTSVREYADQVVELAQIREAVQIAMKAPSVCNRQSQRVRILTSPPDIAAALEVQGGLTGYPLPPALLVVTSDIRSFVELKERNQVYVDGGIFTMALLLALEFVGLAACPLNTMFTRRQETAARELLNVEHENFIAFISVGHFRECVTEPKSFRYTADEIIV